MTEEDWQRRYEASTKLLAESEDNLKTSNLRAEILQDKVSSLRRQDRNGLMWGCGFMAASCAVCLLAVAAIAWAWQWGAS